MFTKEELKSFGLMDEVISNILESQKKKMENYVLKSEHDNVKNELESEKQKVKDRDETIKKLKTFEGTAAELQAKVDGLNKELKTKDEDYEKNLNAQKKESAIKFGVMNFESAVQDLDMVVGLIDKEKVTIDKDGKIIGLDEQLKDLQKNKAFLFKAKSNDDNDDNSQNSGVFGKFFLSGTKPQEGDKNNKKDTPEAIGAAFAANKLKMMGISTDKK